MRISRHTVFVLLGISLGILLIVFYSIQRSILMRDFLKEEEADAHLRAALVRSAVEQELDRLVATARDWGLWDDTYQFVQDRNAEYVEANLMASSLTHLNIDLMTFLDLEGREIHTLASPAWRSRCSWTADVAEAAASLTADEEAWAAGIVPSDDGFLLAALQPVSDSAAQKPWRGWIVVGQKLDDSPAMKRIRSLVGGTAVGSAIVIESARKPDLPPDFAAARDPLSRAAGVDIHRVDRRSLYAYVGLKGLRSDLEAIARIELPRTYLNLGVTALWYQAAASLMLILIFALAVVWILGRGLLVPAEAAPGGAATLAVCRGRVQQVVLVVLAFFVFALLAYGWEVLRQFIVHGAGFWKVSVFVMIYAGMLGAGGVLYALRVYRRFRDQTDRALVLSENTYRAIFENSGAATMIVAPDDTIQMVNTEAEKLSGWPRGEIENRKTWQDFVSPKDLPRMKAYNDAQREGRPVPGTYEFTLVDRSGAEHEVMARARPIPGTRGRVISTIDQTESKRIQRQLAEQSAFQQSLFTAIQDGLYVVGPDFTIRMANATVEQWFPAAASPVGRNCHEVLFGRDRPCDNCPARRTFETGELASELLAGAPGEGKGSRWLELFAFPLKDVAGGRPASVIIHARDATARVKAEENLQATNDLLSAANTRLREAFDRAHALADRAEATSVAKSEFLANLTHEMRTPIYGLMGTLALVEESGLSAEQGELVRTAKASAESLLNVINGLLEYAAVEKGALTLEPSPFAVRDEVPATLRAVAAKAEEKGLDLVYRVRDGVPDVLVGDYFRIHQALLHLVDNGIKFTEHGDVCVEIDVDPDDVPAVAGSEVDVHFVVRDTGIGISPELQKAIFEPFTQGDGSSTRLYGGTGLGLTISKRLIEAMGGRLWLTSEPGQGSHFHFSLPLRAARPEEYSPAPVVQLDHLRVLLAARHAVRREALRQALGRWEAECTEAADADAAWSALASARDKGAPFDLALIEGGLRAEDARELTEKLAAEKGVAGAAICLLMPLALAKHSARLREQGIASVAEPVAPQDLLVAVLQQTGRGAELDVVLRSDGSPQAAAPRVLLAEDDPTCRAVLRQLLEKRGCNVYVAGTGLEAIEILARIRVEVLFLDDSMPVMDGRTAAGFIRVREKSSGEHVRIVAMTADSSANVRARWAAVGPDEFLLKPITPAELDRVLKRNTTPRTEWSAAKTNPPECPVDVGAALEGLQGDSALLRELLEEFAARESSLAVLKEAVRKRDVDAASMEAHRLRGALAGIGAWKARRIMAELEALVKAEHFEEAVAAMQELDSEMAAFRGLVADREWLSQALRAQTPKTKNEESEQDKEKPS